MQSSGFQHAPVSKYLLLYLVASAILVTATDSKHYFYLHLGGSTSTSGSYRHWQGQWQWWRALTWAAAFTNSTEVLFAAVTVYQMRVVERIWGRRKFVVGLACES